MAYRGDEVPFQDLSGGKASNRPVTGLQPNQALDLDNVHSLPGNGIALRQGDTEQNATAAGGGAAFTGLQFYKQNDGTKMLIGVADTDVFRMDYAAGVPDGTFDTITGGVTITAGQDNTWTSFMAAEDVYFVGGAPNVPFRVDNTGNAATFGTGVPSGQFGFFHNNRMHIGAPDSSPSTLSSSTLTDITDFTGDGSQNTDVDPADGDTLVTGAPLNTDIVLLFKQNSIHQFLTSSFPFGRFPLFKGTGAVGKHSVVVHEGVAYFITPKARMKSTRGDVITDYPDDIDDVWDSIPKDRLKNIVGYYEQGKNFEHIKWIVTIAGQTGNTLCIIWDLKKESWWSYSTGHAINTETTDTDSNTIYAGHYDGKVYEKNIAGKSTDDSEASAGISGFWDSGWLTQSSFQVALHPQRINVSLLGQLSGELRIQYGFDFAGKTKTEDVDMAIAGGIWDTDLWDTGAWGGQTDIIRNRFLVGRGNAFQVSFSNKLPGVAFQINGFTISGKKAEQKKFLAS